MDSDWAFRDDSVKACDNFVPNQWRKTLCANCFLGRSLHTSGGSAEDKEQLDSTLWYYAKVEGPFSWEQMRHWHEAGYFKNARLLVRPKTEGSPWRLLDDAFPDSKTAFLPAEALAAAEELGAEPEAIGNILEEVDENQLLPEELKAHEKNMVRYFEQGDNWFFIDAEGETQGSFPGKSMISWWISGYFWNKKLLIGHFGWDAFCTLEEVIAQAEEMDWDRYEAEQAAAAASDEEDAVADEAGGQGHGGEDAEGASHAEAGSDEPPATEEDEVVVPPAIAASEWCYVDEQGEEQGPFGGADMQAWCAFGYFGGDTQVRQPHWEAYLTVSALFLPGQEFMTGSPAEWQAVLDGTSGGDEPEADEEQPEHADSPAQQVAGESAGLEDPSAAVWYYLDEQGEQQGPFSAADMKSWCEWQYFSASTRIAHEGWEAFVPAGSIFPEDALFFEHLLDASAMASACDAAVQAGL